MWLSDEGSFLGHIISNDGVAVDPAKTHQEFFYNCNSTNVRKKDKCFTWDSKCDESFQTPKKCLTMTFILILL